MTRILRDNQLPICSFDSVPVAYTRAGRHSLQLEINRLANLTGAPDSFVNMVQSTFRTMDVPLHEHAGPYRYMLETLFRREEKLRKDRQRVRAYLRRIRKLLAQDTKKRPEDLQSGRLLHRMWHGLEERSRQLTRETNELREQLKKLSDASNRKLSTRWGVRSLKL